MSAQAQQSATASVSSQQSMVLLKNMLRLSVGLYQHNDVAI